MFLIPNICFSAGMKMIGEKGDIKEGVGAGVFALIAQLNGISCKEIVNGCEKSLEELQSRANSFVCSSFNLKSWECR